jgi:lipopolysaccharide/colanic/teichoic acid biosynthesis glycosyltransferase
MWADDSRAWYRDRGKRLLDLSLAIPALLLLAPLGLFLGLLVRWRLGSPVLFRQQRPGLDGKAFEMLKLRTMTDGRGPDGSLLPDGLRLTPLGRALRASSLDELPELFNVLKGEMSLVGPRPLLLRYSPYFRSAERARFSVAPGITGLAQVSGRNALSWDARIAADLEYVARISFLLDLRILFSTVAKVLLRSGLRVDPGASMLDFDEERRQQAATSDTSEPDRKATVS